MSRDIRAAVADEHDDWEDQPTKPGVKPLSNAELGQSGTRYHLDKVIPVHEMTKAQLASALDTEQDKVTRLVRALNAIRQYPEQADGIAAVALRMVGE